MKNKTMTQSSIKHRLILLLLPLITVFWFSVTCIVYFLAQHQLQDSNKSQLLHLINSISLTQGEKITVPWIPHYLKEDHVLAIIDGKGKIIVQTIANFPINSTLQPGVNKIKYAGNDWLLWMVPSTKSNLTYIAGLQLDEVSEILSILVAISSIPLAAILILAIIAVINIVKIGLRPLLDLSQSLKNRSPDNLTPIDQSDQAAELQPILFSLNELFKRIENHLAREHRFIDDAAHEIRTPLTVIKAQSQAIDESKLDDNTKQVIQNIVEGINRTSSLASRLLLQARASQLQEPPTHSIDLIPTTQNVLATNILLADRKEIKIEYEGPNSIQAKVHIEDFQSILENLVGNAIRHTPQKGNILISVETKNDSFHLTVEDSGPGIPLEKRTIVFERFKRLQNKNITPGSYGMGLGLSITKSFCERNNIKIEIHKSKKLGGANFLLKIPRPLDKKIKENSI